jgi:chromosomal replication initiator protein
MCGEARQAAEIFIKLDLSPTVEKSGRLFPRRVGVEIQALWDQVRSEVCTRVSDDDTACWMESIDVRELRDDLILAEVPSRVHRAQILKRVGPELHQVFAELLGHEVEIHFHIRPQPAQRSRSQKPGPVRFPAHLTFDNFVTGASNEFAYHCAREVAECPGRVHNPLILCGGVGLGKTHLATAVANEVWKRDRRRRIVLLTAETFANEMVRAIRLRSVDAFRKKFRRADVLIVDDVQFFAGKERMQEEFLNTFNALYQDRRQIVLVSDQPPRDIPELGERLRSRFECGLLTDVQKPDLALRLSVLLKKALDMGVTLPLDVAKYTASRVVSSIRELEGALQRLVAACRMEGRDLDLASAAEILRPIIRQPAPPTVEQIQRIVAKRFDVTEKDLMGRRRAGKVVFPRQVAMYLARKGTQATYAEIAADFGGRDHTTIMHAVRNVEKRRDQEPELAEMLDTLESRLAAE